MKRAAECVVVVAAVDTQAETAAAAMMEDEYDGAAMSQLLMDPTLLPTVPKRRMPSNNFNDGVSFPQLDALPYAHNPLDRSANIYYRIMDGGSFVRPVRHWCLLAEIVRVDVDACSSEGGLYPRPRVSAVISVDGRRGVVEFNAAQAPETFGWADLRPGSTIAVLYAQLQPPAVSSTMPIQSDGISSDEDEGPCVWVADLGDVFVFNATMSILRYYAQSITIKATDTVNLSPQAVAVQWLLELMGTHADLHQCDYITYV
ncbi:hypothetical protein HDU82_008915 [Entophlyctis luteolus]|nr:hypothetical protein HDU82_008915 [Entophlyctis luteolus]